MNGGVEMMDGKYVCCPSEPLNTELNLIYLSPVCFWTPPIVILLARITRTFIPVPSMENGDKAYLPEIAFPSDSNIKKALLLSPDRVIS